MSTLQLPASQAKLDYSLFYALYYSLTHAS